ncbi:MAG TPA: RtcB family protein [Nitrospiraceae bacterium]|jgi:tRNA-splicing ligase RtcB|nr:RtcB family protein [Nitrospiraceae bacterium]
MTTTQEVRVEQWLSEPLSKPVQRAIKGLARTDDVRYIAVMPDVHLAEEVCIGTAMATTRLIYPGAVGGDIGCGMATVRFNGHATILSDGRQAARLLRALGQVIPAIRHGSSSVDSRLPESLLGEPLSSQSLEKLKSREGRVQLGTLGRGNHFLEFQAEQDGTFWLMVHSGSRAIGQAIRDHHLIHARLASTGLRYLDSDTASGQAYLRDVVWAERYAEENRQVLLHAAVRLVEEFYGLTADWSSGFSCQHNHVRQELHFGSQWWVHRKGAIWAGHGAQGIIPGSMGSPSYHVAGRGHEASLQSSSHGAGRTLSRGDAYRSIGLKEFLREMKGVWFDHRHLESLRDEAPSAYKDIALVMRAQRDLTKIVRIVRPVLNYKAAS